MRLCSLLILLALASPATADSLAPETALPQTDGMVRCLAFSPDGKALIAASFSSMRIWETATWELRASIPYGATSLALSRDGEVQLPQ